jgi:hypothetical protein
MLSTPFHSIYPLYSSSVDPCPFPKKISENIDTCTLAYCPSPLFSDLCSVQSGKCSAPDHRHLTINMYIIFWAARFCTYIIIAANYSAPSTSILVLTYIKYMNKYTVALRLMLPYNGFISCGPQRTYLQSSTVYIPSLELGLPQPLSRKRVCPPTRTKGWGGHTRLRLKGGSQFQRLEKKLSTLPTLCCGLSVLILS